MNSRYNAVSLQKASEDSPTLAGLLARARDTAARLAAIEDLIPADMRQAVQAGPVEAESWCLLVNGSAAAAKLRHLAPALQGRLRERGWPSATLRIKVQSGRR